MEVETDREALLKTVDECADRPEDSRNLTWVAKSNSLWRSSMEEGILEKHWWAVWWKAPTAEEWLTLSVPRWE